MTATVAQAGAGRGDKPRSAFSFVAGRTAACGERDAATRVRTPAVAGLALVLAAAAGVVRAADEPAAGRHWQWLMPSGVFVQSGRARETMTFTPGIDRPNPGEDFVQLRVVMPLDAHRT